MLYIRNNTTKAQLALYKNPEHVGRKYQLVAESVGSHIFRYFLHLVVNRLMESDRLIISPGVSLFIGLEERNARKVVKAQFKKQIYFANKGRKHALTLHGVEHEFFLRMPGRRVKELRRRIAEGQRFYNQLDQ